MHTSTTLHSSLAVAILVFVLALGGCAASSPPVTSGVEPPAEYAGDVVAARAILEPLAEEAIGFSVAVAQGERVVWSEAYGYRDLDEGEPATPGTRYRLYSLSKPLTAAAAARLLEAGRFDASAPVQRYVPEFPDKGAPITPMHLATHASGIRHYSDEAEAQSQRHCESVTEALAIFAGDPLVHVPGDGQTYSSWGYVLLSAALEGAVEQPYEEVMANAVFEPVGLDAFAIDDPTEEVPGRAQFYRETAPGEFVLAAEVDNTCKWGAGAWLGTVEEVAAFGLALVDDSFLGPRTQQLFLRGEPVYRVQGVGVGGTAFLIVDETRDLSVALLSNASGTSVGPALQKAVGEVYQVFVGEAEAR